MRDDQGTPAGPGGDLRALRAERGVELGDLARTTRVGRAYLEALEEGRFADLPAPVFVKGFIRSYCEQLGVPADEHLRRYRHLLGEREVVQTAPVLPPRRALLGPVGVSLILVAVLGGGLFALTQLGRMHRGPEVARSALERPGSRPGEASAPVPATATRPAQDAQPPALAPADPGSRSAVPPPTAGPAAVPGPGAAPGLTPQGPDKNPAPLQSVGGHPLKLVVRAVEQTWLRVQTEDGRVVSELLEPGTTREWTSDNRFVLTVGNAAGIELTLNGQPMPPLGGRGVVRRVEIPGPGPGSAEASPGR